MPIRPPWRCAGSWPPLVAPCAPLPGVLEWGLGAGETAILSAAITLGGTAVVDDREARSAARALGVPAAGTLGVVVLARKEGRIESGATVLREVRGAGPWLDDRLIADALRRVGEEWVP